MLHLASYLVLYAVISALEEERDLTDHVAVLRGTDAAATGRHAFTYMSIEARPLLTYVTWEYLPAPFEREDLVDSLQSMEKIRVHIRAEINGACLSCFLIWTKGLKDSRVFFVQSDADIRVSLIVAKKDVVFG